MLIPTCAQKLYSMGMDIYSFRQSIRQLRCPSRHTNGWGKKTLTNMIPSFSFNQILTFEVKEELL